MERLKDLPSFLQDIKSGRSPLIHAVENNSLSMVQLLLQVGTAPALGLSPTLSSSTSPAVAPSLASSSGSRPLLLHFQICPFLLGLVMSTLCFTPQAALLSRDFSLSSPVPKMSRARRRLPCSPCLPALALYTSCPFRPASTLDLSFL